MPSEKTLESTFSPEPQIIHWGTKLTDVLFPLAIIAQLKNEMDLDNRHSIRAADPQFDGNPLPTEDNLNFMYGHLEVLRALKGLVGILRPIAKKSDKLKDDEVSTLRCEELDHFVALNYQSLRTYAETVMKRVANLGPRHTRTHISQGKTGAAVESIIGGETLDWYSKEYSESAIEALKGLLKVQLV